MSRLEELLFRWSEDALTPAEQDELARHLESPEGRRVLVEQFRYAETVSSALGGLLVCGTGGAPVDWAASKAGAPAAPRRRRFVVAAALAAAAAVALLWVGRVMWPPVPDPQEASHQVVEGRVLLDDATSVQAVPEGAALHIPDDAPAVVWLTDGSRAEFEPGSRAVVHGNLLELRQMIELVAGGGSFRVEKGDGQFQVETKLGRVTALGTEFQVRILPGERLGVKVISGIVSVEVLGRSYLLREAEHRVFAGEKRRQQETRGLLASVAPDRVSLTRRAGSQYDYVLTADASVLIDRKQAKLTDLKPGNMVYLEFADDEGTVRRIRAEGPSASGEVRAVDVAARSITLAAHRPGRADDRERVFDLDPEVEIRFEERSIGLAEIPIGASVLLRFSVDRGRVLQVVVAGERRPAAPRTPRIR